MKKAIFLIMAVMLMFSVSGCITAATGGLAGAAGGAVAGQAIGRNTKSTLIGAGAGGVIGAISGYLIQKRQQE